MNDQSQLLGWRFWGRWALTVILGLVAGMVVFIAIGITAGEALESGPEFLFGLVIGGIFGTAFGVAQWLALKRVVSLSNAWIWATIIGFIVAAAVIFGAMDGGNPDTSIATKLGHGVVLGGALGLAQFLVLRTKVAMAAAWIGISLLAWVIAELAGIGLSALVGPPLDLLGLFLVGSILPGGGMMWLLNRTRSAAGKIA